MENHCLRNVIWIKLILNHSSPGTEGQVKWLHKEEISQMQFQSTTIQLTKKSIASFFKKRRGMSYRTKEIFRDKNFDFNLWPSLDPGSHKLTVKTLKKSISGHEEVAKIWCMFSKLKTRKQGRKGGWSSCLWPKVHSKILIRETRDDSCNLFAFCLKAHCRPH